MAQQWAASTQTHDGQQFHSIFAYDSLPKEQCWIYGDTGILTFVMEISQDCWWSGATVDTIATRVARGSMYLLERALAGPGITGRVIDLNSGLPLQAELQIDQLHSPEVGPRITDARFSQYHRLTQAGQYTVQASYRGYIGQGKDVVVGDSGWATVDFVLVPEITAIAEEVREGDEERDATGGTLDRRQWCWRGTPCGATV